jgi:hypothetical protein
MSKRKPTYEQALALQRGHATQRRQARERAALAPPEMTPEQHAQWRADYKAALAAYRANKEARPS